LRAAPRRKPWHAAAVVTATGTAGRTGWHLPPQPPERWIDRRWAAALLAALASAVALPALALLADGSARPAALLVLHATTACAALVAAYVLLILASVTGDPRLRTVAAGCALLWPVALLRAVDAAGPLTPGVERGSALGLLGLAVLPLSALAATPPATWRRGQQAQRIAPLTVAAAGTGLIAAVLLAPSLPAWLTAGAPTPGLRAAHAVLAAGAFGAALHWRQSTPATGSTWSWVALALALVAVAAAVLALLPSAEGPGRWAGEGLFALAVLVPAAGLWFGSAAGYRRQSRRWRQLVAEVAQLRAGSPLLPGLSVSPQDEEGLPSEGEVRGLLTSRRVHVALQPVVRLADGAVVGFEALSRFGGRISTDRWFRGATLCGLEGRLEQLTLHAALGLLPGLPPEVFLAVNVSPTALHDAGVLVLLHEADLSRVVVEVTEHDAVEDYARARSVLQPLRGAGARIAVDDTGAGFASLRHVLMLQPDIVKLDSSLCRQVHEDVRQRRLVAALLTFAAEVGTVVLAEGVESEEQLDVLRELGVPLAQGWHLGVPAVVT
jgi:EAL domain-containing protein (putative c-di-GMP-specific phosphodiesterase class I)